MGPVNHFCPSSVNFKKKNDPIVEEHGVGKLLTLLTSRKQKIGKGRERR